VSWPITRRKVPVVVQPAPERKSLIVVPTTNGSGEHTTMSKRCSKSMHLYGYNRKINRPLPGSSVVHSNHTIAVPKLSFVKMWQMMQNIAAYESPFSPMSKVLLKPLMHVGYYMYHLLSLSQNTGIVYLNRPISLYNREAACFLWGMNWIFICCTCQPHTKI
jgi:hypothetical protein